MQKNNSPQLRALYIILVPIVLLIIILNSGILQKAFPAARVHGSGVSVVRYNYYYYDWYNRFLEENELRLDELGYDPSVSANSQPCSLASFLRVRATCRRSRRHLFSSHPKARPSHVHAPRFCRQTESSTPRPASIQ